MRFSESKQVYLELYAYEKIASGLFYEVWCSLSDIPL